MYIPNCGRSILLRFILICAEFFLQSCRLQKSAAAVLKVGVSCEDIKKRILSLPGPFVCVRRVVRSYSSTRRPSSKAVQEAMAALQTAGTGSVKTINKLIVFLKKLPTLASPHAIAACGVTPEEFRQAFLAKDGKITTDMQETVMNAHPQKDDILAFLEPTE